MDVNINNAAYLLQKMFVTSKSFRGYKFICLFSRSFICKAIKGCATILLCGKPWTEIVSSAIIVYVGAFIDIISVFVSNKARLLSFDFNTTKVLLLCIIM